MSAATTLGRERHMSYGKLNAAAMTALQQGAMKGNSRKLDAPGRSYGKSCDALIDSHRADMDSTEAARPHPGG
jgi:hypothetical protein